MANYFQDPFGEPTEPAHRDGAALLPDQQGGLPSDSEWEEGKSGVEVLLLPEIADPLPRIAPEAAPPSDPSLLPGGNS